MQDKITWPAPGRYILAVSGGADSMVLMDLMAASANIRGYELTVAHFDHGLRPDSRADRQFVQGAAKRYGLPFEYHEAKLGRGSEAAARSARHSWLQQVRQKHAAIAVVTAHHQDDLIETSLLNLARGTSRRGLAPMQESTIKRPLLNLSRPELRAYAVEHKVVWRDDPTNAEISNPRNFLRHKLLSHADPMWQAAYLEQIRKLTKLNKLIAQNLALILSGSKTEENGYSFPRDFIRDLSLRELEELLVAAALSLQPGVELDRRVVQEVALFAKTAQPHRRRALREGLEVTVRPGDVRVYYMGQSSRHMPVVPRDEL